MTENHSGWRRVAFTNTDSNGFLRNILHLKTAQGFSIQGMSGSLRLSTNLSCDYFFGLMLFSLLYSLNTTSMASMIFLPGLALQ